MTNPNLTDEHRQDQEEVITRADWLAVFGGALGAFMAILDIQVTNASLREIQGALSLSVSESGWVSTAYLIAEIIVIPLTSVLSQVFSIRKYMIWNCVGFMLASLLCGLSWNLQSLIVFRALQGFTGGTLIPMAFQLILQRLPASKKNIGLTIFGLTITLAPTLGPSIGGWLTATQGWRSIFFINLVPGLFMVLALRAGIPATVSKIEKLKSLDWRSVVALAVGLSSLTYMLEEGPKLDWFETNSIRYALALTIIFLPYFIARQFELKDPILKLSLFRNRNFALGTIITAISGCALFSGIYALSLYLGQISDYDSAQIGSVLMWVGMPQLLIMPIVPFLMRRIDMRLLAIIGMLLFAYSNHLNTGLNYHFGGDEFKISLFLRAIGQPLFVIPLSSMAMGLIEPGDAGDASSIFNVMRNLGASIGIALTSTLVMTRQSFHLLTFVSNVSGFDYQVLEKLYQADKRFRALGFDAQDSQALTFKNFFSEAVRDSIIQSFSDIFALLTWALIFTCLMILALSPTKEVGSEHGEF